MRLLRQLARRKLRTTLTILGITIGIWALVVFSSMANKINALVEGGSQYFAGKVLVTDASSIGVAIGTAPMNVDVADQIAAMDGVAAAVPQVQLDLRPGGRPEHSAAPRRSSARWRAPTKATRPSR